MVKGSQKVANLQICTDFSRAAFQDLLRISFLSWYKGLPREKGEKELLHEKPSF